MHKVFETKVRIRFAHCDPAGIVYHPQYIMLVNGVMEDFFGEAVGIPFMRLVHEQVSIPVVSLRTEFVHPSRPGDDLTARLWIERLGRSSVRFAITMQCGDEMRLRMVETVVAVDPRGGMHSVEIPPRVRAPMLPYVCAEGDPLLEIRA